jgi:hypothetical protein
VQQQGSGVVSPGNDRVRLEERYKAIGIAALAAAIGAGRAAPPQMGASTPNPIPQMANENAVDIKSGGQT